MPHTTQTTRIGFSILKIKQRIDAKGKLLAGRLLSNDECIEHTALYVVDFKAADLN